MRTFQIDLRCQSVPQVRIPCSGITAENAIQINEQASTSDHFHSKLISIQMEADFKTKLGF